MDKKESYTHNLTIERNDLPVFIEDAIFPKYLIADSSYQLDDLKGYDFNTKEYVNTSIYVTDGSGINQLVSNNKHSFKPDVNGQAKITYKATNTKGTTEINYTVDVVVVKSPNIDMTSYFKGVNITKNASLNYISISNINNSMDASFDFINYLNVNQFTMKFRINPLQSNFKKLDLYLSDYEYSQQVLKNFLYKSFKWEKYFS